MIHTFTFFIYYFVAPRPTGPLLRGEPNSTDVNHCVCQVSTGHREPRNDNRSLCLTKRLVGIEPGNLVYQATTRLSTTEKFLLIALNNLRSQIKSINSQTHEEASFLSLHDSDNISISQPAITCSKLTIETLEQGVKYVQKIRHWRRSGVFIVNFEHISHLLVFLLSTFSREMPAGFVTRR